MVARRPITEPTPAESEMRLFVFSQAGEEKNLENHIRSLVLIECDAVDR